MTTTDMNPEQKNGVTTHPKGLLMRQLQLVAHGEPSDVIKLNTVSEPALGQEDVLVSIEAAPINPSDFLYVHGLYGVRPAFPASVGAEGVGRVAKIGSKVDITLQGKRVLIIPTYEQGTWADQVVVPVRNIVPMSDEADPLQLSMIGINPPTAYLLLNRYVSLMPGCVATCWHAKKHLSDENEEDLIIVEGHSCSTEYLPNNWSGDVLQ